MTWRTSAKALKIFMICTRDIRACSTWGIDRDLLRFVLNWVAASVHRGSRLHARPVVCDVASRNCRNGYDAGARVARLDLTQLIYQDRRVIPHIAIHNNPTLWFVGSSCLSSPPCFEPPLPHRPSQTGWHAPRRRTPPFIYFLELEEASVLWVERTAVLQMAQPIRH